jgi:hypothetical protein
MSNDTMPARLLTGNDLTLARVFVYGPEGQASVVPLRFADDRAAREQPADLGGQTREWRARSAAQFGGGPSHRERRRLRVDRGDGR